MINETLMSCMSGRGTGRRREHASRGQAEVIGLVLVLAMTLIGATIAIGIGASVINDARIDSNEEGIKNAMTQLDSRTARVALGDSTSQRVPLTTGSYHVDPNEGWINITHTNHSGSGDTEVIYNDTLGAVIYEGDDVTIAYQGGGVWESTGNTSTMVSPPEFHYRGATLTLPIVQLVESDSASGAITARVTAEPDLRRIFPNESDAYDGGSPSYQNPVNQGNVSVEIHSAYYQAWADFFRTRSDGDVSVDHSNETVKVILFTPSSLGDFDMPAEGNGINPSGVGEDHPINAFEITLKPDPHFENMHWAFYADEGGEEFELHIYSPDKCSGGSYGGNLDFSIYYYNGTGGTYQGWQNSSVDPDTSPLVDVDCANEEMTIDFMATTNLTYKEIDITGNDNKWYYGDQISSMSVPSQLTLDGHSGVGEPRTYDENTDAEEIGFLVNHYFEILGPSFELKVADGPGGSSRVDEDASSGTLEYDQAGGAQFITFLHITENRVTVELE